MLRGVVLEGTGTEAAIPGLHGRRQDRDGGEDRPETARYSTSRYVASFVGLVPATKPRLVSWSWWTSRAARSTAATVAAPAFKEIARFNLQHLEVPPDAPEDRDR